MKSLIIEDEPLVAKDLSKLIREIDPSIEIIAQLESLDAEKFAQTLAGLLFWIFSLVME
ncbi:MAG: hypothetical protein IPG90_16265 [Bacteroidetes bacterium]|nr:hypothetical protein [Bacteroidota bacterium]